MHDTNVYLRSRTRARRMLTLRLRWEERHLVAALRTRQPTTAELARLAALRSELKFRDTGVGHG
jgi:hypothetical protein